MTSPPSAVVRAAQDRLLARLDASPVIGPSESAEQCTDEERYEFGELLATGGLGLVRRAFDRRLGRTVAVKELRRAEAGAERRFMFEAAITARLQHPGIVPIHDMGRFASGEPYYCMKLVDGQTLEQIIADTQAVEGRLALLEHVLAAADAVAYAHVHGILHRDLKPANILVGEFGETVVIDWGLAKDLAGQTTDPGAGPGLESVPGSTLTDVGAIVGTLRYMPPEQARGEEVDRRSDVFALGAVLFHVMVGWAPHEGLARADLITRLADGEVEDPGPLAGGAPRALVAIARKAMAATPTGRYSDAGAFADDLRRFLAGRRVDAHQYNLGELLHVWLRRHRIAIFVGAAAVLVLLMVAVVFVWQLRGERDLAAAARSRAEAAEFEAVRRADFAVLAKARGALGEDVVAALALLGDVDLTRDDSLRSARLTAIAAQARGAPDRVLRGRGRRIEQIAALSDGNFVSIDVAGEVRRCDPESGHCDIIVDLGAARGQVVAAAEAPVWAALAANGGVVVRGDEAPESIDLGVLDLAGYNTHRWELSRHGETLAALGEQHMAGRQVAAAYTWDLLARPVFMRTLPFGHASWAALSPDGATIATSEASQRAVLIAGETITGLAALAMPRRFSPSGRYLLGMSAAAPRALIAASLVDGSSRSTDGSVVAMTLDDHALILEDDPTVAVVIKRRRLVLRSLATGELRWASDLEITQDVTRDMWGDRGGFALASAGDRFALQLGDQWQFWSMQTGELEYTLDTGPHRRGMFLADGGFAVAHHSDVWVWSPRPPPAPQFYVLALASDGSHAVTNTWEAQVPRVMRLSDRHMTPVSCLKDLRLHQLADVIGRISVDRRGRMLFVDEDGVVCLNDDAEVHAIAVPAKATVGALSDVGDGFVVGTTDGRVLAWGAVSEEPRGWQLDAGIRRLWTIGDEIGVIAQTGSGRVVALDPGDDAPVFIGTSAADARPFGVRVLVRPGQATAAVLLEDEGAVVFHGPRGVVVRRPTVFSVEPAAAYSPSGDRFVVAQAGRTLLVLASPEDPGRELALPEEARGLVFLDEDALVVVGESGALIRADLRVGEAVVLHRAWEREVGIPTQVTAGASGQTVVVSSSSLLMQAPDPVPWDSQGLRSWLAGRVGSGP